MLRAWVTLNSNSNDTPPYKSKVEVKVVGLRPTEYMYYLLIKKKLFHAWLIYGDGSFPDFALCPVFICRDIGV